MFAIIIWINYDANYYLAFWREENCEKMLANCFEQYQSLTIANENEPHGIFISTVFTVYHLCKHKIFRLNVHFFEWNIHNQIDIIHCYKISNAHEIKTTFFLGLNLVNQTDAMEVVHSAQNWKKALNNFYFTFSATLNHFSAFAWCFIFRV